VNGPYSPPGGGGYPGGGDAPGGGYPGGGYSGGGGYPGGGAPGGGYPGGGAPGGGYPGGGYAPQQDYNQQRGYLQGGPVDFQGAIRQQFENVMNFNGRASRSAYWWYALALFVVDIVLEIFSAAVGSSALTLLIGLVMIVVGLSDAAISTAMSG